jgi:dTDP-glucose 4,6-dehydratase
MKKIIVTGGLGFIGSNLIDLLIKKKFKVINIDKVSYSSNFYNVREHIGSKFYKFCKIDINNQYKILKVLKKEKPIAIFNLAAESHVDRSIDGPYSFIKSNILGTFNLLESLRKYYKNEKKIKFIHVSTDEVYGDVLKGRSKENSPYQPSSPYAATKASSDHLVYSYFRTYGLPVVITNCSNNYGPKQHPEKLIPKLIYNILNNIDLPIYGNGKNKREWIYVEDHCSALFKIFKEGKIGDFYNIGSNDDLDNLRVAKKLLSLHKDFSQRTSISKIIFVQDRPGHDIRYALNSDKIINELRWKKKNKFNIGIKKTFEWYKNNLDYFKKFKKKDILKRIGKND